MSFLNPIRALINPIVSPAAGSPQVKETTRVEREAPIEDVETSPDSNTTGIMEPCNFVDFYERLQAIRHQMGLDSNQTLTLEAVSNSNSTLTLEFVLPVISNASRTSPIVNFLYLWLIIMIFCVGILGSIAIYENAPSCVTKDPQPRGRI